jgi:hypothetical protein
VPEERFSGHEKAVLAGSFKKPAGGLFVVTCLTWPIQPPAAELTRPLKSVARDVIEPGMAHIRRSDTPTNFPISSAIARRFFAGLRSFPELPP